MEISNLKNRLISLEAKKSLLEKKLEEDTESIKSLETTSYNLQRARWVLTEVSKITQMNFKTRVEELVTVAIRSIFDRPFEFHLKFEQKRNRLEITPVIIENGQEFIPKDEMGGGILPVIGFALRVVLWSMENPRSRNTIIMDEPFAGIGSLMNRAGSMLQEISNKLGIQLIITTHDPVLSEYADKSWEVKHNGSFSKIREM